MVPFIYFKFSPLSEDQITITATEIIILANELIQLLIVSIKHISVYSAWSFGISTYARFYLKMFLINFTILIYLGLGFSLLILISIRYH